MTTVSFKAFPCGKTRHAGVNQVAVPKYVSAASAWTHQALRARSERQAQRQRVTSLRCYATAEPIQAAWLGPAAPRADNPSARNVVAVIDHTTASLRAVSWALGNLYRDGDVLHLLHVVPPSTNAAMANGLTAHAASFDDGDESAGLVLLQRTRENIEKAFVKQCREAGARVEVDVIVQGRCSQALSDAIIGKVEELSAAVVVMPEQRQTLFESFFFQTPVAQQVAQRCKRPTVLIR